MSNGDKNEERSLVGKTPLVVIPQSLHQPQGKPGVARRSSSAITLTSPYVLLAVPEDLTESERTSPIRLAIQAPDGLLLDLQSARQFTVLTWGEKLILKFIQSIRVISQKWITHVLLVLVLLSYTALGGVMFHYVEGSYEDEVKNDLADARSQLGKKVWLFCKADNQAAWYENFAEEIKQYERVVASIPDAATPDEHKWDYIGSLFFSGTVFTTIGYGHIVPSTDYGRALTMVYALVGIPLILMVLADLGKMFTRTIKFVWSFVRRFYYTGSFKRLRSSAPLKAVNRLIPGKRGDNVHNSEVATSDFLAEPEPFTVDENFDLPVSIALIMLLIYILLGALMMKEWETDWSYFHAVYFIFVSLTTIGFGDMVPKNPTYLLITFIYLLFGLALTSMCINVVQVSITNTFTKAKNKLALRIGLSASTDNFRAESIKAGSNDLASIHGENNKNKSE